MKKSRKFFLGLFLFKKVGVIRKVVFKKGHYVFPGKTQKKSESFRSTLKNPLNGILLFFIFHLLVT